MLYAERLNMHIFLFIASIVENNIYISNRYEVCILGDSLCMENYMQTSNMTFSKHITTITNKARRYKL